MAEIINRPVKPKNKSYSLEIFTNFQTIAYYAEITNLNL